MAIAPVLRTIQVLSNQPNLRAPAVTLMTSLWRHQDRCFPYLQQLITDSAPNSSSWGRGGSVGDEVTLARAAAIRDVCKLRCVAYVKPQFGGWSIL